MNYRFITILHNMNLESIKNKGKMIIPGARISNGASILQETLETKLMNSTLGVHSVDEFDGKVYFYCDGNMDEKLKEGHEFHELSNKLVFLLLRQAQAFAHNLWEVKDNSVYVRDGFLLVYSNHLEDGLTYKGSLSEIFTSADNQRELTVFSDTEIDSAANNTGKLLLEDFSRDSFGGKYPDSSVFLKKYNSTRKRRANYFTAAARKSHILPLKIFNYVSALECLFTVGKSEINHKIAERVALFIGESNKEKKYLFSLIKNAYSYRSSLVHGQHIKGDEEPLEKISLGLDEILRRLLVEDHSIFNKKDDEIEEYFIDLLFKT